MKQTIKEWLQLLPEPARTQALQNHEDYKHKLRYNEAESMAEAISRAFDFVRTPQGFDYWNEIRNNTLKIKIEFHSNRMNTQHTADWKHRKETGKPSTLATIFKLLKWAVILFFMYAFIVGLATIFNW